jgi:hypothetical protein
VTLTVHPSSRATSVATGQSTADGTFQNSNYRLGDGALPDEYSVTCIWGTFDPVSRGTVGDRLDGHCASVKDSPNEWTITDGDRQDIGIVELEMPLR